MSAIIHVSCCIAGGGPAGMMAGFLLARAGVDVLVLEKHEDFLRDFRGDTIHPSTLEVMHELGLLESFLARPHQEARQLSGLVGGQRIVIADFSHVPTVCKFIALMPQWDFLNFLAVNAKKYPSFRLMTEAEVEDLIEQDGRVVGVKVSTSKGPLQVKCDLVIGADGRRSTVRQKAGLKVRDLGAPMDVLWMRISRKPTDPYQPMGVFDQGRIFVMIERDTYWQCAFVIPKGDSEKVKQRGLEVFQKSIVELAPFFSDRVQELKSWDDIKLLTVAVDRLEKWFKPGLLCIGDAAHAMSPVGGVGINLAIQDAIAAANILAPVFKEGVPAVWDLARVQKRRMFPTRATQRMQLLIQRNVIQRTLNSKSPTSSRLAVWAFRHIPFIRRIPARLIGVGFRPEHVSPL